MAPVDWLRTVYFNSDGLGATGSIKRDALVNLIRANHLTAVCETRSNKFDPILKEVPGVKCFASEVRDGGRKGQGVAVFVQSSLADHVSLWRRSSDPHVVWLRVDKVVWGTEKDVMFGVAYIPHGNSDPDRTTGIHDAYTKLSSDKPWLQAAL